jgi:DegV family protein with EDD domain
MDSAGDMPPGWADEYDIQVIPINIQFGEQTFLQGVDLKDSDFYRIVDDSGVIPQTSQPSPQQFVEFYKKIAQPGDQILSLHVTGKLSGTFASAQMAARELEGQYDIFPFDSASGSAAMGYMCREARLMEWAGASVSEILGRWQFIRKHVSIILTLNTLEYARKSGRVKALQAALASILNVKPVIALKDGVLDMADRVRTRRKALEYVVESTCKRVGDQPVYAAVVHAEDINSGEILMGMVRKKLNCRDLIMTGLSVAVAANLGPGTAGVVAYPVEEVG